MQFKVARHDPSNKDRAVTRNGEVLPTSSSLSMTVAGLFAGIGGLELGLEQAGHRTLLLCEILPEAHAVLRAAQVRELSVFDCAVHAKDVTRDLKRSLPDRFDILTAGFPCQDLSQAGRTAGINGSQSGLIGHVLRMLKRRAKTRRPSWIILENVPFMRHLANGTAMNVVLKGLSELGYSWAYRELDTLAFGLPQRRRRLFIVACLRGVGDPRRVLLDGDVEPVSASRGAAWREGRACGFYWTEGNRGVGWADDAVPPLKGGSGLGIPSPPAIIMPDGALVLPTIRDAESLQGFPRGWTEPAVDVDPRGGRVRWQLVGNSVSVPIAKWIGERLAHATSALDRDDPQLSSGEKWPSAAWQMDPSGARYVAALGTWPIRMNRKPLLSLLGEEDLDRPQLSHKATSGFLTRFEASNLLGRHDAHRSALLDVLRRHVDRTATS